MRALIAETFPRSLSIRVGAPPDLWLVEADATQLHQVLLNLSVNARDAMPDGGTLTLAAANVTLAVGDPRLELESVPGRYVVISVTDSGSGIAPDVMPRIFDPFFTTKGLGQGTGLGLSTVLGIVKSHGGFVKVESEPGRGSTFHVYLPALEHQTLAAGPILTPAQRGSGQLILVVDDEEAIRKSLRVCLEKHGYRVLVAADGAAGLALYREHMADIRLVLTDLMMPVLDGRKFARRVRDISSHVPIIASSGLEGGGEVGKAEPGATFTEFLSKPYDMRAVLDAISRHVLT